VKANTDWAKLREHVLSSVRFLMMKYGPDGHTDGADEITDYIIRLLKNDRKRKLMGAF
jgi:hypothetical protein